MWTYRNEGTFVPVSRALVIMGDVAKVRIVSAIAKTSMGAVTPFLVN